MDKKYTPRTFFRNLKSDGLAHASKKDITQTLTNAGNRLRYLRDIYNETGNPNKKGLISTAILLTLPGGIPIAAYKTIKNYKTRKRNNQNTDNNNS